MALVILVLLLRLPEYFSDPIIWAEDGAVFLRHCLDWPANATALYAGQLWPLQRALGAGIATGVSPTGWALATYLVTCAVVAGTLLVLLARGGVFAFCAGLPSPLRLQVDPAVGCNLTCRRPRSLTFRWLATLSVGDSTLRGEGPATTLLDVVPWQGYSQLPVVVQASALALGAARLTGGIRASHQCRTSPTLCRGADLIIHPELDSGNRDRQHGRWFRIRRPPTAARPWTE